MDSLRPILESARAVGEEYCWPASQALEAIQALAKVQCAVLGAELWRFDGNETPEVVGWSEYSVALEGAWVEVVARCARAAQDAVLGNAGDLDLWVNLTGIGESSRGST